MMTSKDLWTWVEVGCPPDFRDLWGGWGRWWVHPDPWPAGPYISWRSGEYWRWSFRPDLVGHWKTGTLAQWDSASRVGVLSPWWGVDQFPSPEDARRVATPGYLELVWLGLPLEDQWTP